MVILNLSKSNKKIIDLIKKNESFSIVRLGGTEARITYDYILTNKLKKKYLHNKHKSLYNAGIYTKNENFNKIKLFCNFYHNSIAKSNILASFLKINKNIQTFYSKKYKLPQISHRSLEPFYILQNDEIPWTHYLKDKKVLIINPFVESFKLQLKNGFQIFKNKKIFLDNQQFVFYKSYQTIAGNHIHNDWFETFKIMCKDIEKLDFDIALLGCGGYGLPLCNYIKSVLNKSAIYIGGGLQLLFGVMGKRWENIPMWKNIINENNTKFIKPSSKEICKNYNKIESGCYW